MTDSHEAVGLRPLRAESVQFRPRLDIIPLCQHVLFHHFLRFAFSHQISIHSAHQVRESLCLPETCRVTLITRKLNFLPVVLFQGPQRTVLCGMFMCR